MKIAVITAAWRRPTLTRIYWEWLQHLAYWWEEHEVLGVTAVSEEEHTALALEFGGIPVKTDNRPLGRKFNAALAKAGELEADAVLVMGSDDFLDRRVADELLRRSIAGSWYVGLEDLYMLDLRSGEVRWFMRYKEERLGEPQGCGRLFRRELLDKCDWHLWDDSRHQGMDHSATRTAKAIQEPEIFNVRALGGCAIDCKSADSLHKFHPAYGPHVAAEEILDCLPDDVAAGLRSFRRFRHRRPTMPEEIMRVRFVRNVCYKGTNYGPDYDEDVTEVTAHDGRAFMQQGRARPVEVVAKRIAGEAEPDADEQPNKGGLSTTSVPAVRTSGPAPGSKPTRSKKGRAKSKKGRGKK